MGYLNNTGLSHFWDKLKQFFVKKSEVENAGISSITYTTVLASTTVTTALATGYRYPSAVLSSSVPNNFGQAYLYRITINNTEKRMPCVLWFRRNNAGNAMQPIEFIGNPSYMLAEDVTSYYGHGDVDTTCGFCISARDIANDGARKLLLFTPTAGSYTVKIELENRDVTKFPPDLTFDNYNNPISEVANRNDINSLSIGPNYMKNKTGTTSVGAGNMNSGVTSTSVGVLNEASGQLSVAVGTQNKATNVYSTAIGNRNESTGAAASAFGYRTAASGQFATTNGNQTIANHKSQFVFGEMNEPDPSIAAQTARGRYVEIVGNGADPDNRSNARTLDWDGNERLAGSLTLGTGTENEARITPEVLKEVAETNSSKANSDVYSFRKAAGTDPLHNCEVVEKITGGTVAWNQYCDYNESTPTANWSLVNATLSISGRKMTITSASNSSVRKGVTLKNFLSTANHKYLVSGYITPDASNNAVYGFYNGGIAVDRKIVPYADGKTDITTIFGISASGYDFEILTANATPSGSSCVAEDVMLIDLTQMFGSAIADYVYTLESVTAGAGIAWLKKYGWFTKPYYPYKAASLESVKTSAHKTIGFNQWDEEWRNGKYATGTGAYSANSSYFANKNPIRVLPNTTYYIGCSVNATWEVFFYTADGSYIEKKQITNATFATPSNCAYINFSGATTFYGTTYKHDI
ncbi:MAG: hypothetical protein II630_06110, partial [Bacteroidales bacterium]|nr:hypothetical protein [Bacteroidales bacterium]